MFNLSPRDSMNKPEDYSKTKLINIIKSKIPRLRSRRESLFSNSGKMLDLVKNQATLKVKNNQPKVVKDFKIQPEKKRAGIQNVKHLYNIMSHSKNKVIPIKNNS